MALTDLDLANQALRNLGDDPITSLTDTNNRRSVIVNTFYATVRDATLQEHPWNFATDLATLYAYTEPAAALTLSATSGTITVTAAPGVFAAADVGKEIRAANGVGRAEITVFTSSTTVTAVASATFGSTSYAAAAWRLYYDPPPWKFANTIPIPAGVLRVWRVRDSAAHRVVKDGRIVTDADTLDCELIYQITDPAKFPPLFVQTFVAHLTAILAEPITGQNAKAKTWLEVYGQRLMQAKAIDGLEGTPEQLVSDDLVSVRW